MNSFRKVLSCTVRVHTARTSVASRSRYTSNKVPSMPKPPQSESSLKLAKTTNTGLVRPTSDKTDMRNIPCSLENNTAAVGHNHDTRKTAMYDNCSNEMPGTNIDERSAPSSERLRHKSTDNHKDNMTVSEAGAQAGHVELYKSVAEQYLDSRNVAIPPVDDAEGNVSIPPVGDVESNVTIPPVGDVESNVTIPPVGDVESNVTIPPVGDVVERLKYLGNVYSKAQGSHTNWRTDVNLGPPNLWCKEVPKEDRYIQDYYNSLQYTLYETGHPETVDRTTTPRADHNPGQVVAVAIMASPAECVGILLEGGQQLPDAFHLILSTSWLSRQPSAIPGLYSLWIHKAITFHGGGFSFIDEFTSPRRVTYFTNFFTTNITGNQRNDGEQLEVDIDCPISTPVPLAGMVDDKLWTRCIMATVGMAFPETLALVLKPTRLVVSPDDRIRIVTLEDRSNTNFMWEEVATFLSQPFLKNAKKVVVKPSGPAYYGSIGVTYHSVRDMTSVVDAITGLIEKLEAGNAVLVERYIETFLPPIADSYHGNTQWSVDENLAFRVRTTVCRDFDDKPVTSIIVCGIASKETPINGDCTVSQSLDSTLLAYNVNCKAERQRLQNEVCRKSEAVLQFIIDQEKSLGPDERGAIKGYTDVIGIDIIIERQDAILVPVGIEVNSHDCTINCQIQELMHYLYCCNVPPSYTAHEQPIRITRGEIEADLGSQTLGRSVRPLVRTMITRSQGHIMAGKRLLVVGGGGYSKRQLWPDAKQNGLEVTLVDSDPNHLAKDIVDRFVHYDFTDHSLDTEHAQNIANMFCTSGVDGCLTIWEDCVPLAAIVAEILGLPGNSSASASIAKKKSRTQIVLGTKRDDIPHWPRTYLYASQVHHFRCKEDLENAIHHIQFPSILKLEHGSSAVGVVSVSNQSELRREYERISSTLRTEHDFSGVGLGHDNSVVAIDYNTGSEHDVDVVMYDRKLRAAFISDNGPTQVPKFIETTATMPSLLPADKQAQLVAAAYQCCTEIGLSDGVFNVEFIMTPTGPKLIEINARMGGFYLRDWIKRLYGVDLLMNAFMISCGICPFVPKCAADNQLMGVMVLPSLHGHILNDANVQKTVQNMHANEEIIWTPFAEKIETHGGSHSHDSPFFKLENVERDEFHEEPFGNISVAGDTVEDAKLKLLRVCNELNINNEAYPVEEFIKFFRHPG